ncbi:MAG: ABC transporter ATP-binding protein [Gammaproteobacteria bacterium]|nr:ABC transporter ATP-binding protein [Gammaproteobacteria bacterium]MYF02743.1 ABC transporter ATP-binding protein [Gammaproteobacteria bacterium]MYI76561.1 ABC transporter ATP-binding protein [Gammaproteobacteria bacterium]
MNEEIVVEASNIAKSYKDVTALTDLSLQVSQGQRCVLLGPNGAGKSTFLNLILGVLKVDRGSLSVFGKTPGHISIRRLTGAMLQISGIPSTLKVQEHLKLFRTYYHQPLSTDELVRIARLEGLERRTFGSLSGGQQQRLNFALALCGNPKLLILDEPSTSHDVEARMALWDEVDQLVSTERTLLLATHNLQEAERLGDRILIFHDGRVIADASPAKLRSMIGTTEISAQTNVNVDVFERNHQVKRIEHVNNHLRLYVSEAESTVRQLLQLDPNLKNLAVKPASLQDAYLHLLSPARFDGDYRASD